MNGLKINFPLTKIVLMHLFLITKVILIRQRAHRAVMVKWLRPWTQDPTGSPQAGSNPVHSTCQRFPVQVTERPGSPGSSDGQESACNAGDQGQEGSETPRVSLGSGRSPGGGHGNILQYSCLDNPHGQRSLEGYRPWGCKESGTTERRSAA